MAGCEVSRKGEGFLRHEQFSFPNECNGENNQFRIISYRHNYYFEGFLMVLQLLTN